MGHTEKTHKEFYEITQNAYQTAKVANLLNLFDKGEGAEYRNMTLQHIDIDPRNVLIESDDNSGNEDNALQRNNRVPIVDGEDTLPENTQIYTANIEAGLSGHNAEVNVKKANYRIRWTSQQKKL